MESSDAEKFGYLLDLTEHKVKAMKVQVQFPKCLFLLHLQNYFVQQYTAALNLQRELILDNSVKLTDNCQDRCEDLPATLNQKELLFLEEIDRLFVTSPNGEVSVSGITHFPIKSPEVSVIEPEVTRREEKSNGRFDQTDGKISLPAFHTLRRPQTRDSHENNSIFEKTHYTCGSVINPEENCNVPDISLAFPESESLTSCLEVSLFDGSAALGLAGENVTRDGISTFADYPQFSIDSFAPARSVNGPRISNKRRIGGLGESPGKRQRFR